MKGFQLTSFTEQNRQHHHTPIGERLLKFARDHGAAGTTMPSGAEGVDHAGCSHCAQFFELADPPSALAVSVDEAACPRLRAPRKTVTSGNGFGREAQPYGRTASIAS